LQAYTRRQLLKTAAALLVTAQAACTRQPVPAASAVDPTAAASTLSILARDLFPHDAVSDETYGQLAEGWVNQNPDVALLLIDSLDAGRPRFAELEQPRRLAAIEENFANPALQAFRFSVLVGLYADVDVTKAFGYQGPSIDQGGYLTRGFDDLDWLPDPE